MIAPLNAGAAMFAVIAAICWFRSAQVKAPELEIKDDWANITENSERIASWLKESSRWNRLAACFTGVSGVLMAAAAVWN